MKRKNILLTILMFFIVTSFAYSDAKLDAKISRTRYSRELDFKNVMLPDALSIISKTSGVTIVGDTSTTGISLDIYIGKNKTLKEILDVLKASYNLRSKTVGDVIVLSRNRGDASMDNTLVGKVKTAGYENGVNDVEITLLNSGINPAVTQFNGIFIMENVNPGVYILKAEKEGYEVEGIFMEVKGGQNNFVEIDLNKIYPKGQAEQGKVAQETGPDARVLGQVREEGGAEFSTERVTLKHAFPEDVKNVLESSMKEIEVSAFPKLNMVIIKGAASNLVPAKRLIEDMDRPMKQVRITAQILDVTDNLFEDLGFNWDYNSSSANSGTNSTTGNFEEGSTLGLGTISNTSFNLVRTFNGGEDIFDFSIDMLQSTQDLAISAVPSLVVLNGEEAEFKITDEVIVGQEITTDDDDTETTTPLFEEAGIVFNVKPIIREGADGEDTILLTISSELSNFNLDSASGSDTGTFNEDGGSKSQRNIDTTVRVNSGESLFIGGLKRADIKNVTSKVPLLGDIPFVGFFFRNESASNQVRDIYIKIKAEIIDEENSQTDIDLKGFKKTELHRTERDILDHRKVYPRIPESPQILGTPNFFSE